jgi:YggT family protein
MIQTVSRIFSTIITIYMLIIFVRIILTWFSGVEYGRAYHVLASLTDPYLSYFRRFSFLRIGTVDFSPIAGLIFLVILLNIFNTLAAYGRISLGIVLAIILQATWSAVSFLLTLFIILIVIRFVAWLFRANTVHPFIRTIDMLITPYLNWVHRKFFRKRFLTFQTGLAIGGAGLIVVSIAGGFAVGSLTSLLQGLPF